MGLPTASSVERISTCAQQCISKLICFEKGQSVANRILGLNLVVVGRFGEGERKHTLLLQVGLVDTGKASGDDSKTTKMAGLESSVLTGATLAVVPVANNNPLDALLLVITGDGRDSTPVTGGSVLNLVGLTVGLVDSTNQHVVGDVIKMATVLEPGTSHGDVVSGSLALGLDENGNALGILAIPGLERLQNLETVRGGSNLDIDSRAVLGRSLVSVVARIIAGGRKTVASRRLEHELVAILVLELVGQGVEVERASNGEGNDQVGGGDEGVSGRVSVVATSEVTVVGGEDGVGLALLDIGAVPLANARAAGVGKNDAAELLESLKLTITGNSGTNLLGSGGDGEDSLGLDTVIKGVASNGGSTGHVLVRGVGARANKTNLQLLRPAVLLDSLAELGDGSAQIGGEGAVDVRLKLREVNLNQLVILGAGVLTELLGIGASEVTDLGTLRGGKVVVHTVVEGENGGSGTNFGTPSQC